MGRPKKQLDYNTIEKLASIHCTQEEIAFVLNVGLATLKRDPQFRAIYKKGESGGKLSLRRLQWESANGKAASYLKDAQGNLVLNERHQPILLTPAVAPNITMQIWLGKQVLNQSDKMEETLTKESDAVLRVVYDDVKITPPADVVLGGNGKVGVEELNRQN